MAGGMKDKTATVLVSHEEDDAVGRRIIQLIPGVEVVAYDPDATVLDDTQRSADILVPSYRGSHRPIPLITQLPRLRMVQLLSAGVDEWIAYIPANVTLASARGAHAGPVSEWVISAILTQMRQWPALVRFQDSETWAHRLFSADTLAGKRALIVGAGSIGTAVAARLSPFGALSTLVARTARDGVYSWSELSRLIPGHDIVVISAPLNDETRGLMGRALLALMDDGALLVNVGRGQIVDTEALVAELRSGRLRAALDVTDPEPLPQGHPLWKAPNVIISPHSARTVPGTNRLCYEVAAEQIQEFIAGRRPANAIER
ncbi:2-hydroxyacid dehydrogenase [Actinosynnema sp. CS-041913]|uniref:2-hydroxyacid dehydrogenase n=1 Tax=Actinosynnema sp. CS-041913 TaxID=3239917 RepID=UPI003D92D347